MPPVNDNFTNRTVLTGASGSWSGTNVGATTEAGEPIGGYGSGFSGDSTIWFEWTAPSSGLFQFNTFTSALDDTVIDVFVGTTLTGLTLLWANDDTGEPVGLANPSPFDSQVPIVAVAGRTYILRISGFSGATGTIVLSWDSVTVNPSATVLFTESAEFTNLGYLARMVVTVPPIPTIPGPGTIGELDFLIALPESAGGKAIVIFMEVDPTGAALLAGGCTIDSAALPAGVTAFGSRRLPPQYYGSQVGASIWDDAFAGNYSLGYTPVADPASAANWWLTPPPPVITSFTPATGSVGDTVVITGRHFLGATRVGFRHSPSFVNEWVNAVYVIDSDTQITATVPSGACTGPIVVTAPAPSSVDVISGMSFTMPGTLGISGVSPTSGEIGTEVTVTGTGFLHLTNQAYLTDITTFSFGQGLPTIDSDTQCRFTVNGFTGPGVFRVRLLDDLGHDIFSAATLTLTVVAPPTVTSFTPPMGPAGTTVTVTGTGFVGTTAVRLGATSVVFHVVDDSTLTFVVPPTASSGVITVANMGGSASSSASFTVLRVATTSRAHLWKDRG